MSEAVGIENLKKAITVVANLGEEIERALEDGKFGLGDVIGFSDDLIAAITVATKGPELVEEVKDLSAAEQEELALHFAVELNLAADRIEVLIEEGVGILVEIGQMVARIIAFAKNIREEEE